MLSNCVRQFGVHSLFGFMLLRIVTFVLYLMLWPSVVPTTHIVGYVLDSVEIVLNWQPKCVVTDLISYEGDHLSLVLCCTFSNKM